MTPNVKNKDDYEGERNDRASADVAGNDAPLAFSLRI